MLEFDGAKEDLWRYIGKHAPRPLIESSNCRGLDGIASGAAASKQVAKSDREELPGAAGAYADWEMLSTRESH
jgi:hypothetical protein